MTEQAQLDAPELTEHSRIELHELGFRDEGTGQWVVGRRDGGGFIEVPEPAVTFIAALRDHGSIPVACAEVKRRHDVDLDGHDLARSLHRLTYVRSIDGRAVTPPARPPSLRRVRPEHVRWLFGRTAALCALVVVVAGGYLAAQRGPLLPDFRIFFFTDKMSVVVSVNTAMALLGIAVHEFAHLAAARSVGVPARFGIGTRMQFLVAQTDVSGMWLAEPRARVKVYLAGIMWDLVLMGGASLTIFVFGIDGLPRRLLEIFMIILLLSIAFQLRVYLRTDLYFVLQELFRCKNLYRSGWRYAASLSWSLLHLRRPRDVWSGPLLGDRSPAERRAIRLYAFCMIPAYAIAMWRFLWFAGPVVWTTFVNSGSRVVSGTADGDWLMLADGLVVVLIEGALLLLFVRTLCRNHVWKLTAAVARLRARWLGSARDDRT